MIKELNNLDWDEYLEWCSEKGYDYTIFEYTDPDVLVRVPDSVLLSDEDIIEEYINEMKSNIMLKSEEIAENMLSDIQAYRENIKEIIISRLMDSSHQRAYWDAWFRGAKGKDLEDSSNGKIYKEVN